MSRAPVYHTTKVRAIARMRSIITLKWKLNCESPECCFVRLLQYSRLNRRVIQVLNDFYNDLPQHG